MKRNEKIRQEILKTMDQFNAPERLEPDPYFYTRLQAELREKRHKKSVFYTALRVAFYSVLLVLNVGTTAWYLNLNDGDYQDNTRRELSEILATDLILNSEDNSIFLFEEE